MQYVRRGVTGRVGFVHLDRPPVNALNAQLLAQFDEVVRELHADSGIGVIVVAGFERIFSAGADIRELDGLKDPDLARAWLQRGHDVFGRLESGPKPAIAAVRGACLGGGCELALACHLRIAGESARFGQPEIKLGVIPGWGGTQRLPGLIGLGRALEMLLTGEPIGAETARTYGLVNAVVPDEEVLSASTRLAEAIATYPIATLRALVRATMGSATERPSRAFNREIEQFLSLVGSPAMLEGVAAFLEKRAPRFHV